MYNYINVLCYTIDSYYLIYLRIFTLRTQPRFKKKHVFVKLMVDFIILKINSIQTKIFPFLESKVNV